MAMQEPGSDEEIRRLIGEEGPSWRRTTDIRVFYLFIYASCVAAILGAVSIGILLDFSFLSLVIMAAIWGLAYGNFKKSRLCAILLFVCGAVLTTSQLIGKIPGVLGNFPMGFLAALLLGVIGTFVGNTGKRKPSA